jgi:hypothetical protein
MWKNLKRSNWLIGALDSTWIINISVSGTEKQLEKITIWIQKIKKLKCIFGWRHWRFGITQWAEWYESIFHKWITIANQKLGKR